MLPTRFLKEVMDKIASPLSEVHGSSHCSIAVWDKKWSIAGITSLGI